MRMDYDYEIDCSPRELWPYLEDPKKQKLWMTGFLENETIDEKPGHVGTTFRLKLKEGKQTYDYQGEITSYDLHRHLGIKMVGGCMGPDSEMFCDYRLDDLGNRTMIHYSCHGELRGFWRILSPLFAVLGRMHLKKLFRNLEAAVRGRGSTGAEPATT